MDRYSRCRVRFRSKKHSKPYNLSGESSAFISVKKACIIRSGRLLMDTGFLSGLVVKRYQGGSMF